MIYMELEIPVCKKHKDAEVKLTVTPEIAHYGKWICTECQELGLKSFVKWAKNPKTTEELTNRQSRIRQFLMDHDLSTWTDSQLHRLLNLYNKPHLGVEHQWYEDLLNGH